MRARSVSSSVDLRRSLFSLLAVMVRNATTVLSPTAPLAAKVAEYRAKFANPYVAAARGFIDEVIAPRRTRQKLITALANLDTKRDRNPPKKHGNIPL